MGSFLQAFSFMANHGSLVLSKLGEHLQLSGISLGGAALLGVPLGVWLGHLHRGSVLAINLANIGRALPSLAVIAIGVSFLGLGLLNNVVALVVLAAPVMLTNSYVAVDQVDPEVVEAARGMGLRPFQVLVRVEVPLALPLIFAGIRTATVFVVATATLAGVAGGGGLGDIIVNQAGYGLAGVWAGAILVAALALAADGLLALVQRGVTPGGLRRAPAEPGLGRARADGAPTLHQPQAA